jgi:RNA polymerase sigma-70 factor (ECF subfamily)
MPPSDPADRPNSDAARDFHTTRWSLVLAAGQQESADSREALATLCQIYWYPLYVFARRQVAHAEEAQDLTQEFFAQLLEKDYLRVADPERGKFRSFLLTAFKHFLAKERDRARALKRGGGSRLLPLDFQAGEQRYSREPAHKITPEKIFERRWALALLDRVLARLRTEFEHAEKQKIFDRLKICLTGEKHPGGSYQDLAAELQITEGAVKVAVYRLRRRYQELLRDEISQTVAGPADIEDELRHLFEAVRASRTESAVTF